MNDKTSMGGSRDKEKKLGLGRLASDTILFAIQIRNEQKLLCYEKTW